MRTGGSWSLTNSPQSAGIFAGPSARRAVSAVDRGLDSVDFGFQSLGPPNPFLVPVGVAADPDQDQSGAAQKSVFQ